MEAPETNSPESQTQAPAPELTPEQARITAFLQEGKLPEARTALLEMILAEEPQAGVYHPRMIQARMLLARIQAQLGEPVRAEEAIAPLQQIPESDPQHGAVFLNARVLIATLRRLQARFEEAFGLSGAVLDQLDAVATDPVNPDSFRAILQLVNIAREAGQYQQALDVCVKGIERFQGKVGEAHAHLVLAAGTVLLAAEQHDQAREHFEGILKQATEQIGEENELVARAHFHLAQLEHDLDEDAKALEHLESCVRILSKGADPEFVVDVEQLRLPLLLKDVPPVEALQALGGYRALVERVHGPRTPKVAEVLSSMGYQHRKQGDGVQAKACYEDALSIWRAWRVEEDTRIRTLGTLLAELG